jgi:hypothetical protein
VAGAGPKNFIGPLTQMNDGGGRCVMGKNELRNLARDPADDARGGTLLAEKLVLAVLFYRCEYLIRMSTKSFGCSHGETLDQKRDQRGCMPQIWLGREVMSPVVCFQGSGRGTSKQDAALIEKQLG